MRSRNDTANRAQDRGPRHYGTDRRTLCPGRARRRQAFDRLLGSLGPRRQHDHQALVNEWAAKEKVEVTIDYIPSQGNKNLLTIAAEAQARSGHDILAMPTWWPQDHAKSLEPVDDIMEPLIKQNGAVNDTVKYLGKAERPLARGAGDDRQPDQGAVLAHRPDEAACRHRRAGDVSGRRAAEGGQLDLGHLPQGRRSLPQGRRSVRHRPRRRRPTRSTRPARSSTSFGAELVDAKGNITVKTDAVRQALEYCVKLAKFYPPDAPAWDDASNNKWLVSGQGRADHESAERLGGRQARRAAGRRAVLDARLPVRPEGPLRAVPAVFLGDLELLARTSRRPRACWSHLSQPAAVEKLVAASGGYDLPSFANLTTFKTWAEEGPPKGTLYHYPNPHNHQTLSVAAAPAPPKIAQQIYTQAILTKMIVRHMQGEAMEKTLAWAESEVEGFMRT